MKVYLDTGVFLDYLIYRGHAGLLLREKARRNRTIQQLSTDVTECLNKIQKSHEGFTSSLTLYEAEEALFSAILESSKSIIPTPYKHRYIIMSSRIIIPQILTTIDSYDLELLNLSEDIIRRQAYDAELQKRGVRAGDSLHIVTAIISNADIIISTDEDLLCLNEIFTNQNGIPIKCLDTNDSKNCL